MEDFGITPHGNGWRFEGAEGPNNVLVTGRNIGEIRDALKAAGLTRYGLRVIPEDATLVMYESSSKEGKAREGDNPDWRPFMIAEMSLGNNG